MSRMISKAMFTKARLKGAAGIAGLTAAGLVIATLPGIATSAEWIDNEWVSATQGTEPGIGTADCEDPQFSTRGAATFLELNALVIPDAAEVGDLEATNDGTTSTVDPAGVPPLGPNPPEVNQYLDDIDLALLNNAISAQIPAIDLPLNTDLGVLASYAEAQPDGYSAAGSGLITNTGALDLDAADDPGLEPLGTLSLSEIVDAVLPSTSPLVNYLADLDLEIGAVGSSATLDACPILWNEPLDENLTRDYLIAALDLDVESVLVSDIFDLITGLLEDIDSLDLEATVEASLLADLTPILGGIASGGVTVADVVVDAGVSIDTTALASVLTTTYDGNGIVTLNLADGTIGIDLANLLGGPNGLNDLPANTELLINEAVLDELEAALLDAIGDLLTQLDTAIATVLGSITVTGQVTANLVALGIPVATVVIPLNGDPVVVNLLPINCADPVNAALCLILPVVQAVAIPAVELLLTTALSGITDLVDDATDDAAAVVDALTDVVVTALNLLDVVDSLLFQLLEGVLGGLFDAADGLLSIVVNAQSAPTGNANPIPTNFQDPPVPAGQYDVAAIRIGVLDLLGDDLNVDLTLARSSVGQNIYIP